MNKQHIQQMKKTIRNNSIVLVHLPALTRPIHKIDACAAATTPAATAGDDDNDELDNVVTNAVMADGKRRGNLPPARSSADIWKNRIIKVRKNEINYCECLIKKRRRPKHFHEH
jgi:hypothetical protein